MPTLSYSYNPCTINVKKDYTANPAKIKNYLGTGKYTECPTAKTSESKRAMDTFRIGNSLHPHDYCSHYDSIRMVILPLIDWKGRRIFIGKLSEDDRIQIIRPCIPYHL